jgi:hypothetical protein
LLDGPRAFEEILDRSYGYLRLLGLFKMIERQARDQMASVREKLGLIDHSMRNQIHILGKRVYLLALGEMNGKVQQ